MIPTEEVSDVTSTPADVIGVMEKWADMTDIAFKRFGDCDLTKFSLLMCMNCYVPASARLRTATRKAKSQAIILHNYHFIGKRQNAHLVLPSIVNKLLFDYPIQIQIDNKNWKDVPVETAIVRNEHGDVGYGLFVSEATREYALKHVKCNKVSTGRVEYYNNVPLKASGVAVFNINGNAELHYIYE
jgi:hypothetical protein